MNTVKKIAWLLGGITLILMFVNGAVRHSCQVNTDSSRADQSAYMSYATALAESNYTFVGDRNRMPIYPFVQSLHYRPGLSEEDFFVRGKQLNIVLSAGLLVGLFLIARRYLPPMAAVNLILITAFTVFIFKAAYFQAELLHYFLSFCGFLLSNKILHRTKWHWGMLTGVIFGVAYLTKASALAGLVLLLAFVPLQAGYRIIRRTRDTLAFPVAKQCLTHLLSGVCVAVMFLATVRPYIANSKRLYGSYFYNVNSTFYVWYDSWAEVERGTRAHGDRVGWPNMPADLIPSARTYLRDHSLQQIAVRFLRGIAIIVAVASQSYGYFKYIAIYLIFCLSIMIFCRGHTRKIFGRHAYLFVFNMMYFGIYLLLYAWYTPISLGERFTLAHFLPLMFAFSFLIYRLYSQQLVIHDRSARVNLVKVFETFVFALLILDVRVVLSQKIVTMFGGN